MREHLARLPFLNFERGCRRLDSTLKKSSRFICAKEDLGRRCASARHRGALRFNLGVSLPIHLREYFLLLSALDSQVGSPAGLLIRLDETSERERDGQTFSITLSITVAVENIPNVASAEALYYGRDVLTRFARVKRDK